jgi:pimeloyl-ACP methyl ester carboxylesterase
MHISSHRRFVVPLLAGLLLLVLTGPAGAVVVLFKDGFTIQGRITQATDIIVDPKTGRGFPIPKSGEPFKIDDDARRIIFSPSQVVDVLPDPPRTSSAMVLKRLAPGIRGRSLPQAFEIKEFGPWDKKWHRKVTVDTANGQYDVDQRISILTPRAVRVDGVYHYWIAWYKTPELGPEAVRDLLHSYYAGRKTETDTTRRTEAARFLLQAGWPELAGKELAGFKAKVQQGLVDDVLAEIKQGETQAFVDGLQTAYKAGQYQKAGEMLAHFFKEDMGSRVEPKVLVQVQELKTRLAAERQRLQDARRLLQTAAEGVPDARKEAFGKAVSAILDELSADTLPRLQAFLDQARSWDLAAKQGRKSTQTAEQVLAVAVSGWLLGNEAANDQADAALRLWQAREVVLTYQRENQPDNRRKLMAGEVTGSRLRPDVLARIIKYLPPPEPWRKLAATPMEMQCRAPDGGQGSPYLVQLPPEYHHSRAYPVLIVLHNGDEKPADNLKKWSELAARHGFILAAPRWSSGIGTASYAYSEREHAAVLSCLWDLRRRFQVDSDRIFLFGFEQGGYMALDVGLSHPDLFAGVSAMAAYPNFFAISYWHNAQFLPVYVVDGDKQNKVAAVNDKLFESWSRRGWPALLMAYRGRVNEWFSAEPPIIMDWMSRKKRIFPQRTLGRANHNEEFQTMRATDSRFYWLSADSILPRHLNNAAAWNPSMRPALLQAEITGGNFVHLHTSGLKQVSVWLGPGMINFDQKVKVQINGAAPLQMTVQPSLETLLEDFYQRGDRQQVFLARIKLKM